MSYRNIPVSCWLIAVSTKTSCLFLRLSQCQVKVKCCQLSSFNEPIAISEHTPTKAAKEHFTSSPKKTLGGEFVIAS